MMSSSRATSTAMTMAARFNAIPVGVLIPASAAPVSITVVSSRRALTAPTVPALSVGICQRQARSAIAMPLSSTSCKAISERRIATSTQRFVRLAGKPCEHLCVHRLGLNDVVTRALARHEQVENAAFPFG